MQLNYKPSFKHIKNLLKWKLKKNLKTNYSKDKK